MLTSILRTVVPALWAAFINWALVVVPVLEPHRDELLGYGLPLAVAASAVLTAAWYAFWRWLQPRLPDWLARVVLGSSKTPEYGRHEAGAPVTGNITIAENGQIVYDARERASE